MTGRQRWGWHQLRPEFAEEVVAEALIPRGATVIDVGAGEGALTGPLLARGARVVAVEAHAKRAAVLRERFAGEKVVVVQADASELRLPRHPYYIVANPPFAITGALLRRLLQPGSRLVAARLVLQRESARRWASVNAPAASRWQRTFAATVGRPVPRRAFSPPPRVDATLLLVDRRSHC